jgi:hypothetical protein
MCTKSDTYTIHRGMAQKKSTEEQARKKAVGPALHEVGGSFWRSLSSFWILFDAIFLLLCPPIFEKKESKIKETSNQALPWKARLVACPKISFGEKRGEKIYLPNWRTTVSFASASRLPLSLSLSLSLSLLSRIKQIMELGPGKGTGTRAYM